MHEARMRYLVVFVYRPIETVRLAHSPALRPALRRCGRHLRDHGRVDFAPGEILSHVRSTGSNYADSTIRTHVVPHMLHDGTLIRRAPGLYRLARHRSAPDPPRPAPEQADHSGVRAWITEDAVKAAVEAHLVTEGWEVEVRWGRERGIDIVARSGARCLVLEAKGEAPLGPQQVNYFLGAMGELVQRLSDNPTTRYGLALPDNASTAGWWTGSRQRHGDG